MTGPQQERILSEVAAYYSARLEAHGATSRGVDWNGTESHQLRHRQFLRLVEHDQCGSIIDLGCGFGDFLGFLRSAGHRGHFRGYDVAPSMIEAARELHGQGDDRCWHVGASPDETADFAIASGIFNVKGDIGDGVWLGHIRETLDVLARAGRKGFGFNVLSLSSDPDRRRPHLYYADPLETLSYCLSRYGRSVALLQDYGLYEFTVLVRHSEVKP
ncbi:MULTISPECIES: class I SAM-dependent methyltransferase [unclassified Bradyrhizobium]|uniref:class I SAM-dependent methyltransferase n=1 Tax=unclassified Bradyrhizobium TaxID=2631580 RepID=UPI001FF7A34B|nr:MULTISPECIES: class I SAM-dependent methyltransferase [unclassified Bradyrhizobium]MCK1271793.1 class I SAM-dependent methyltransferase [Bradyrhizobium sp. 84]MCK1369835.1 class I SAM-dependent methyltransferase [Bradyrhizobium sp. 49]MCK1614355.1 class I SAM-dependent methyltransferase [Bradyrhizobium sp. 163]MCK1765643.1 class I SAM-dependent methyltransferase [Bradyrhizobium sp. 136]